MSILEEFELKEKRILGLIGEARELYGDNSCLRYTEMQALKLLDKDWCFEEPSCQWVKNEYLERYGR